MRDSKGWTHVGGYGHCHIYAKGANRHLVDPKTGKVVFRYKMTASGIGRNVNIKEPVSRSVENEGLKMSNCELLATCPFFNDSMYAMAEKDKEQYCKGDYTWCGRYMSFRARQRELERKEALELLKTEQDGVKATSVKT